MYQVMIERQYTDCSVPSMIKWGRLTTNLATAKNSLKRAKARGWINELRPANRGGKVMVYNTFNIGV